MSHQRTFRVVLIAYYRSPVSDGREPVLEASLSNVELRTSSAEAVWAATGSVGGVQVMVHSAGVCVLVWACVCACVLSDQS